MSRFLYRGEYLKGVSIVSMIIFLAYFNPATFVKSLLSCFCPALRTWVL